MNKPIINMKETGNKINCLRKEAGMSVIKLTNELGYSTTQVIYKWLEGKTLPSPDNLVALAYMFNVTVDDILVTELT